MADDVRTRVADGRRIQQRVEVKRANGGTIGFLRRVQQRVAAGADALRRKLHHSHAIAAFRTPPPSPPLEEVDPWRDFALRHVVDEEEDELPVIAGTSIYGGPRDWRMPFYVEPAYTGLRVLPRLKSRLWHTPYRFCDDSSF